MRYITVLYTNMSYIYRSLLSYCHDLFMCVASMISRHPIYHAVAVAPAGQDIRMGFNPGLVLESHHRRGLRLWFFVISNIRSLCMWYQFIWYVHICVFMDQRVHQQHMFYDMFIFVLLFSHFGGLHQHFVVVTPCWSPNRKMCKTEIGLAIGNRKWPAMMV